MIRRVSLVVMLVIIFGFFVFSILDLEAFFSTFGKDYFFENGLSETGSVNLVTGIYLDYRLFDSLFEAGLLIAAVSGVTWISQHEITEKNATFMLDRQSTPTLFVTFSRLVYPFMLMFGIYVILFGHVSPGGGFQGGAIVATAILILYYIDVQKATSIDKILTIEKILFLTIIGVGSISFFTKGTFFTNPFDLSASEQVKAIYLITLNALIGIKVALGLVAIFTAFLKEGR
ncbi:MAG: MnhB domain-containing protein [Candidatus Izemoplasmatales bacterium]|nr:MnhB domain-containing protein [bacterium]MDZ4196156.1 MnhB domain-containing protein [Candidatus Izemoplasmatales bacterium]